MHTAERAHANALRGLRSAGSLLGAFAISRVSPEFFERLFGVVMLALLVPILRPARASTPGEGTNVDEPRPGWSPALRTGWLYSYSRRGS